MTETKRLYTVTVEFDFAVMAESEYDARSYANEAQRDLMLDEFAHATPTVSRLPTGRFVERRPDAEGESLVYGTDEDTTLNEAVAAEKKRLEAEALAEKQTDLFTKEKPFMKAENPIMEVEIIEKP
jgi:hypothetical protein